VQQFCLVSIHDRSLSQVGCFRVAHHRSPSILCYTCLTALLPAFSLHSMFFGFNVFDPKNSPAINTQQESYSSRFTAVRILDPTILHFLSSLPFSPPPRSPP